MIITQTPIRISFFGGGTDFREFYRREGGCVLSTAIDKYIFVIIKERFDRKIRVGYTRTEMVDTVDEVQHELVRECLRHVGIQRQVEIATMADIPSQGSGLGSSSAVTVGLLHAMYTYVGAPQNQEVLARDACTVEVDVLRKPIGVQDQYIAAYGGLRFIQFNTDGSVTLESLILAPDVLRQLEQRLLLFYTNVARRAETVLAEQVANIDQRLPILRELKAMAHAARANLMAGDLDDFGRLLHQGWQNKKRLASGISNGAIDEVYAAARQAGCLGGKITGAGGGGFLLLYCPPERHEAVRTALHGLPELPFRFERDGAKVIFNVRR